jgi:hypothetical protein
MRETGSDITGLVDMDGDRFEMTDDRAESAGECATAGLGLGCVLACSEYGYAAGLGVAAAVIGLFTFVLDPILMFVLGVVATGDGDGANCSC